MDYTNHDMNNPIIQLNEALPDRPVSSMMAMQAIVKADGDLDLAAVRLNTKKANVLSAIITDPNNHDTLAKYFRAHQTIRMFSLIETVSNYLEPKLEELPARELAKLLTSLSDTFNRMTEAASTATSSQNPMESVLKLLPPHVQEAVISLAQDAVDNRPTSNISDDDDDTDDLIPTGTDN